MAGLRERKKRATRIAIRDAGMQLFAEQGFARHDDRPDRRGGRRLARDGLQLLPDQGGDRLRRRRRRDRRARRPPARAPDDETTIAVVRAWLGELAGWLEPELVLQQRLAREVPVVGARRLQLYGDAERVIADSLEAELGPGRSSPPGSPPPRWSRRLRVAEETAAARMEQEDRALTRRRGRPRSSTAPWPSPRPASPRSGRARAFDERDRVRCRSSRISASHSRMRMRSMSS